MSRSIVAAPDGATISYVASPLEDIVNFHWEDGGPASMSVSWAARVAANHYYEAGMTVMNVSVVNLPALSKTHFEVGTTFQGDPPIPVTVWDDSVRSDFPDGSGTISGSSLLTHAPVPISGLVGYSTTAEGGDRFGGAASVSIVLNISLPEVQAGAGYTWHASASALGAGFQNLVGEVGSGGSLAFTAVYTLDPPSLSFHS